MRFLGMISFLLILTISLSGCPNVTTDILDNVIVSSNTASSDIVSSNNVSSDVGTSNITSTSSDDEVISSDTTSVIYSSKVDSTLNDDKITYKTLNIPMIDDKKFEEWLNFALNLEEAEKFFPKNCISSKDEVGYTITFHCKTRVAHIYFDQNGIQSKYGPAIYDKTSLKSTDFNSGLIGKDLNYIYHQLDPDGYYLFLEVSTIVPNPESVHYTADGYIITIKYNTVGTAWIVSEIVKEKL